MSWLQGAVSTRWLGPLAELTSSGSDDGTIGRQLSSLRPPRENYESVGDFFDSTRGSFNLLGNATWRQPQLGAIGALLAHWSLGHDEPSVISIPTGSGKTAVALAAPFLATNAPTRVLVLAPSQQVRHQLTAQFSTYAQLVALGVLPASERYPSVFEMTGRVSDWSALEEHDVVVALPNSISPVHYPEDQQPPPTLFDLLVVDEAHHAPARTWSALL